MTNQKIDVLFYSFVGLVMVQLTLVKLLTGHKTLSTD